MDWNKVKADYEQSDWTYRQIGDKYGVTADAVRYRKRKFCWKRKNVNKEDNFHKINSDGCITSAIFPSARTDFIVGVADKLLVSLARAADELDCYTLKNKVKTKTIEYSEESGKTECEEIYEKESIDTAKGIVDRSELKMLVTALCDIKEIYNFESQGENKIEELIRGLCDDIH